MNGVPQGDARVRHEQDAVALVRRESEERQIQSDELAKQRDCAMAMPVPRLTTRKPVLRFPERRPVPPAPRFGAPPLKQLDAAPSSTTLVGVLPVGARPVLPFQPAAGVPPEEEDDADTLTLVGVFSAAASPVLPFRPAASAPPEAPRTVPTRPATVQGEDDERIMLPGPSVPAPLTLLTLHSDAAIGDAGTLPAPPPMIGPLARPQMVEAERKNTSPEHDEAPAPATPKAPPPVEATLPLATFPVERCAAIAASIARRAADRTKLLEENELTQRAWDALLKHWTEEIRRETRRGEAALLEAYDRAYVARLEEERGPIQVEDYARLMVAGERGSVEDVLAELTLPRGAKVRIERVWLERMSADPRLGGSVSAAMEAARERR